MTEAEARIGFAATDFLNPDRLRVVRETFGNMLAAWNATQEDWLLARVMSRSVTGFFGKKNKLDIADIQAKAERCNARLICITDEEYPVLLRETEGAPIFLWVRGQLDANMSALAVVGTRKATPNGKLFAEKIIPELTRAGLTIISGLARGIDAAAHRATIESGGTTIAVLGNGIDAIYPPEHLDLSKKIIETGGAIISEFAPGVPPNAYNFPRRNRVVSGLSLGTLVVEGEAKSGSLITAEFALEQNREVFAVPGNPLQKTAAAPNNLIQRGEAKLILSAEDILEELPIQKTATDQKVAAPKPNNPIQNEILGLLETTAKPLDEIARKSNLAAHDLSAQLTLLEMQGYVVHTGHNAWARKG